MLNIVLFGPPGAGKGTQAANISQKFGLTHLSTGDILRGEVSAGTPLGQEAKVIMDAGKLCPDQIVIGMIDNKVRSEKSACNGFVFDGFPRTVAQAQALDEMLATNGLSITVVVNMEVEEEELVARLLKRGQEQGRTDDNEETIRKRFHTYLEQTLPVAEFYRAHGKLTSINGIGSIGEIQARIEGTFATV
jgi:adenylate kinase